VKVFLQAFLSAVALLSAAVLHAQEFSADTVSLVNGKEIKGKMYYKPDRRRIDAEAGGKRQISIVRMDKKLVWHIADQQKQYLQLPLSEKDMADLAVATVQGEVRREAMGKEAVHGRGITKYRVYSRSAKTRGSFTSGWTRNTGYR
jgi:PIN domain nuclease of toxin-antitoxin system